MREYYVYILSNASRRLYVGMTNDLEVRVYQHKRKLVPGFTSRYNLTWLVFHQAFGTPGEAIEREKELKGWGRARKIVLIEQENPRWMDLARDWYQLEAHAAVIADERPPADSRDPSLRSG
jgi:putative endonuclease